jgi:CRP/FNR family transcriptional regulator, nitrogen oxide reductase regulator
VSRPLLFAGLSEAEQQEFVTAAVVRVLKPRDVLGRQGDPADLFALVQIGHLKLGQINADGAETLVRFLGPGDCYGAVALIPGKHYPVSAVAVESSSVLTWSRPMIAAFAERWPKLKSNIFEEVTRRMAGALSAVQELATERVPQRLASALLRLAEHGGAQTPEGLHIAHPVTRQELADLTGATLFTVSRLMAQWEAEGLLKTGRGSVTIVDTEGLEAAGASDND